MSHRGLPLSHKRSKRCVRQGLQQLRTTRDERMKAREERKARLELYTRFRCQSEALPRAWLAFLRPYWAGKILSLRKRDPLELSENTAFSRMKNAKLYQWKDILEVLWDHKADVPVTEKLHRAVVTTNACVWSVLTTYQRLKSLLGVLNEFKELQWLRADIRPRLLVHKASEDKKEVFRLHDFFRIETKGGYSFVMDLTSWQFGFNDWFFTWEDYKNKYLAEGEDPQPFQYDLDADSYLKEFEDTSATKSFMLRFRDKINQMSDEELKEFGSDVNVKLSSRVRQSVYEPRISAAFEHNEVIMVSRSATALQSGFESSP
ncbi:hypothetical protein K458DRAFT_403949 [Lentithecium fluviatile CBS 122367]|uniref:Uncharacterized protein n=1 Tax=Lentithecium fluviatile CBS 122367 TaxID=1168545 RepID=A0A6G1J250_9PLEO|nr:hypothetical protein K458DRAFT_403949 [Lentithecium fluviatile CBS 122367]